MPEETKRAVREVHNRGDDDEGDYPTPKFIEKGKSRPNEQLNQVVTRPSYNVPDIKTGSRHKGTSCGRYQIAHSFQCYFSVKRRPRSLFRLAGRIRLEPHSVFPPPP